MRATKKKHWTYIKKVNEGDEIKRRRKKHSWKKYFLSLEINLFFFSKCFLLSPEIDWFFSEIGNNLMRAGIKTHVIFW